MNVSFDHSGNSVYGYRQTVLCGYNNDNANMLCD